MKAFIIWTLSVLTAVLVLMFIISPSVVGIAIPLVLSVIVYVLADRWYNVSGKNLDLNDYI